MKSEFYLIPEITGGFKRIFNDHRCPSESKGTEQIDRLDQSPVPLQHRHLSSSRSHLKRVASKNASDAESLASGYEDSMDSDS